MSDDFPFAGASDSLIASTQADNDLPLFQEYAWNFDTDKFIYDGNGNHKIVTGAEALKVWIYKALKTERYSHEAYSWNYGIEIKPFIGKVMESGGRYDQLKGVIKDCLLVNPYITSVDSIDFSRDGKDVSCSISLTTIYGEVNINV